MKYFWQTTQLLFVIAYCCHIWGSEENSDTAFSLAVVCLFFAAFKTLVLGKE